MTLRVALAGAGLGGLASAIALARRGFSVEVFEAAEVLEEVGAGIQLSPNGMKVLDALELGAAVRAVGFEPENATVRDGMSDQTHLRMPLRNMCVAQYGAPYVHVHRADLHQVLLRAAQDLGVTVHLGAAVLGYENRADGVGVEMQGRSILVDVLVGADGVRSNVAAQMHPGVPPEFTGQTAWRALVDVRDLSYGLIPKDATVWVGPGKHFVAYYVRGGAFVNVVAVEERDDWPEAGWTQSGDVADLREAFAGWNGRVSAVLRQVTEAKVWTLFDRPVLPHWSDGCAVLLGDACHPTLPFMAQGAAMAIEDGYVLAACLADGASVSAGLMRYEALRKDRTAMIQARSRANAALFHLNGPLDRMKLRIAGLLPAQMGALPFRKIYGFDATRV